MFYAAEALLLTKGLKFSKHKAVISAFGQHFAKPRLLKPELHQYILEAFDDRWEGDYGPIGKIDVEIAEATIARAEEFLKEAKAYLLGTSG